LIREAAKNVTTIRQGPIGPFRVRVSGGFRGAVRALRGKGAALGFLAAGACLAAFLPVVWSGGALPTESVDHFRPGRMNVHQAEHLLEQGGDNVAGCLAAGDPDRSTLERAELSRLFGILSRSAVGRDVLSAAELRNVHICIDHDTKLLAYYFADMRVVGLNSGLSEGGRIVFLAHELAHVPQHPVYSDNRYFPPRDLVLLRRMREASAEATATLIAWQLRQNGYADAWNAKMNTPYKDVALAFETAFSAASGGDGGDGQRELAAARAAFDRWFKAEWRLKVYDRMTVAHLDRISGDRMGLVAPKRRLTHGFLQGIATLHGGDFLSGTDGQDLTDPYYSGNLAPRLAAQVARFSARALRRAEALAAYPFGATPLTDVAS
jgi:hypothetical protein